MMSRYIYLLIISLIFCVGCNNSEETTSMDEAPLDVIEFNYHYETKVEEDTEKNIDSELIGTCEDIEEDFYNSTSNDEESNVTKPDTQEFLEYIYDNSVNYSFEAYGDQVVFSDEECLLATGLESEKDIYSVVRDFDCDGFDEVFICEAFSQNEDEMSLNNLYYFDDNELINLPESVNYLELNTHQYLISNDCTNFLTLNGTMGLEQIGEIITFDENGYNVITGDLLSEGHKYFIDDETILWIRTAYLGNYSSDSNGWSTRCYIPYFYKYENCQLNPVLAEEISYEEITACGQFDDEKYKMAESVQYLFRENGELEVNFAVLKDSFYSFFSDVYCLEDNGWTYKYSVKGYYVENPMHYDNCNWDIINSLK